jgi:hypothetical protein
VQVFLPVQVFLGSSKIGAALENFEINKSQSVNKKNCFEEVRFFGTILWRELKSYQKIALLTERKKEQARLQVRFLALRMFLALLMLNLKKD